MDNNLSLLLKAKLDPDISAINTEIKNLSGKLDKLKIKIDLDTTDLKNINGMMSEIKKIMSAQSGKLKVFDGESIKKEGQEIYSSLQEVTNKYKELGKLTFPNKSFDPITKDLTAFTMAITKSDGAVEKLKFDLVNIASGTNELSQKFMLKGINLNDNVTTTSINNIREQTKAEKELLEWSIKSKNSLANQKQSEIDSAHTEALRIDNALNQESERFLKNKIDVSNSLANQKKQEIASAQTEAIAINKSMDAEKLKSAELQKQIAYEKEFITNQIKSAEIGKSKILENSNVQTQRTSLLDNLSNAKTAEDIKKVKLEQAQYNTTLKEGSNALSVVRSQSDSFGLSLEKNFIKMVQWTLVKLVAVCSESDNVTTNY